jgi:hypothetical protein
VTDDLIYKFNFQGRVFMIDESNVAIRSGR